MGFAQAEHIFDLQFWQHDGIDLEQIRESIAINIERGEFYRGGSTITQQLAKNLYLSPARNPIRKLKELFIARRLEAELGKRRILELYLNVVQFGPGAFGAEAAARRYFGKPALFLTEAESAMLAAGLTQPSRWNPASTHPDYQARVELIRRRMINAEFLWRHLLQL